MARPHRAFRSAIRVLGVGLTAGTLATSAVLANPRPPPDELPEYIADAVAPYGPPPDSVEVAELLARWRSDGGLRSPSDRIVGAGLWRRAGVAALALDLLDGIRAADDALAGRVRLERARVLLELGVGTDPTRGASEWRAACRATAAIVQDGDHGTVDRLRSELWADLGFLATPEEHESWPLLPDRDACAFLEALVEERAFRMGIEPDERLAIHYRRLRVVRRLFALDRPRFYVGMTHFHGRREDVWMDDRGLIYLRMGPPHVTQSCGTAGTFDAPLENDMLATCWVYDRPGGYRPYYFSHRNKVSNYLSPTGDAYLQESLGPRAFPGDPYFHRYVKQADLPRSLIRFLTLSRHLSVKGDDFDAGLDRAEAQAYRHQMRVATRRFADEALIEIPDAPPVAGAEMLWEALRFANPADGTWQVWVVASLPAGQLTARQGVETWAYETRGRLAARGPSGVVLDSASNRAVVDAPLPDDAGLPVRMFALARPGPLPISLSVRDGARPELGAWALDTISVPRILPIPTVSDIAVARTEGGSWTRDGSNFLRVSPDHVAAADRSIHVYFEVYGIRRTAEYEVEIRLTPAGGGAEAFDTDPGDLPFRLAFTAPMPRDRIGTHALRLDLSGTEPGAYDLSIRARDLETGTRGLPSVTPLTVPRAERPLRPSPAVR